MSITAAAKAAATASATAAFVVTAPDTASDIELNRIVYTEKMKMSNVSNQQQESPPDLPRSFTTTDRSFGLAAPGATSTAASVPEASTSNTPPLQPTLLSSFQLHTFENTNSPGVPSLVAQLVETANYMAAATLERARPTNQQHSPNDVVVAHVLGNLELPGASPLPPLQYCSDEGSSPEREHLNSILQRAMDLISADDSDMDIRSNVGDRQSRGCRRDPWQSHSHEQ